MLLDDVQYQVSVMVLIYIDIRSMYVSKYEVRVYCWVYVVHIPVYHEYHEGCWLLWLCCLPVPSTARIGQRDGGATAGALVRPCTPVAVRVQT